MKKYLVVRMYKHVTPTVVFATDNLEAATLRMQSENLINEHKCVIATIEE